MPTKSVFTLPQIIAQLSTGQQWHQNQLGYAFTTSVPAQGFPNGESDGLSPFNSEQRAAARTAVSLWEDLIDLEINQTSESTADILFTNYTDAGQAYAYLPPIGDIFINPDQASNFQLNPGGYGLLTLVHELGHALGLDHPGDYDAGRDSELNYRDQAEYFQDSHQYTVMSYWSAGNTGANHGINNYASTPMVHDIAAIQAIYGADQTTRTGNTVYGFNSTADRSVFDFASHLYSQTPIVTIWDAGGIDTLDLSGYSNNARVDLNDGAYSDAGGLTQNIAIAFNAIIENAIGGQGNDLISGNEFANHLEGGAGNDVLTGAEGNDILSGGVGNDTATFSGHVTSYTISHQGSNRYSITGIDGTDTLLDIEYLQFQNGITYTIADAILAADGTTVPPVTPNPPSSDDAGDTISQADPITLATEISGTVGIANDLADVFVFTAERDGVLEASLSGLSQDIDLYLFDAFGNTIDSSALAGSDAETIFFYVREGATYYLGVTPYLGAESAYSLTASLANDVGNNGATAARITLNTTLNGRLGEGDDDADVFIFTAENSGVLEASLSNLTQDLDLYLLDTSGNSLATSTLTGNNNESFDFNVQAGSTYFLLVNPYSGAQSDYTLSTIFTSSVAIDASDTRVGAELLPLHSNVRQAVGGANDAEDYFQIRPESSGEMHVTLSELTQDIDLYVYDSVGGILASSILGGPAAEDLYLHVTEGETYYIHVSPYLDAESNYLLTTDLQSQGTTSSADNNDSITTATHINLPGTLSQTVGYNDDELDYFKLTPTQSGTVTVDLTRLSSDIDLAFLNASGSLLTASVNSGYTDETLAYYVTAGQTYYIRVQAWLNNESAYELTTSFTTDLTAVDAGNSFNTATNLALGEVITQDIGGNDPADFYRLITDADGNLVISMSGLSEDADMRLYDSNQTEISQSFLSGTTGESISLSVQQGEVYYLLIDPWQNQQTNYSLSANISETVVPEVVPYTTDRFTLAEYNGNYATEIVTYNETTQTTTINGPEGLGSFIDIDRIIFSDGTLVINREDLAFDIYRLYEAAFDRTPDLEGLSYWIDEADNGMDLPGIANSFYHSAEFEQTYGSDLSNQDLVDVFYRNVLDREGDAEGIAYWLNDLENGMTIPGMLVSFSNSAENITNVEGYIDDGVWFI